MHEWDTGSLGIVLYRYCTPSEKTEMGVGEGKRADTAAITPPLGIDHKQTDIRTEATGWLPVNFDPCLKI